MFLGKIRHKILAAFNRKKYRSSLGKKMQKPTDILERRNTLHAEMLVAQKQNQMSIYNNKKQQVEVLNWVLGE